MFGDFAGVFEEEHESRLWLLKLVEDCFLTSPKKAGIVEDSEEEEDPRIASGGGAICISAWWAGIVTVSRWKI